MSTCAPKTKGTHTTRERKLPWCASSFARCPQSTARKACVYSISPRRAQRERERERAGAREITARLPPSAARSAQGEVKTTILLADGWWSVSRHFHYVPEILAALCWSLPGGFTHALPYFYVTFLTILLVDRAFRDEGRMRAKYGAYWNAYVKAVPWKIVPGLL